MKRTIDKNRAASGRNLWRLMLGTASLFFLASLSSFGQNAIADDPMWTAFTEYMNSHRDKDIVIYLNNNPDDANAVTAVKNAMILENPSLYGLSPEKAAQLEATQTALVAQLNFMAAQFAAGVSASDAAYAWEREQATLNGDVSTSGSATVGSIVSTSGNGTAAPASAGNGAPTMTAAP